MLVLSFERELFEYSSRLSLFSTDFKKSLLSRCFGEFDFSLYFKGELLVPNTFLYKTYENLELRSNIFTEDYFL
jgi:hypothetical protein